MACLVLYRWLIETDITHLGFLEERIVKLISQININCGKCMTDMNNWLFSRTINYSFGRDYPNGFVI